MVKREQSNHHVWKALSNDSQHLDAIDMYSLSMGFMFKTDYIYDMHSHGRKQISYNILYTGKISPSFYFRPLSVGWI